MISHFAELSEELLEMLSISFEGDLLKLPTSSVTVLFLHIVNYFLHFLEKTQMD